MKDFLRAGASVYDYWNVATEAGGFSTWGWSQNSMISVDLKTGDYTVNPDYYVFKHLSHFVQRGANGSGRSASPATRTCWRSRTPTAGSWSSSRTT